jgi:hypothetical protein
VPKVIQDRLLRDEFCMFINRGCDPPDFTGFGNALRKPQLCTAKRRLFVRLVTARRHHLAKAKLANAGRSLEFGEANSTAGLLNLVRVAADIR